MITGQVDDFRNFLEKTGTTVTSNGKYYEGINEWVTRNIGTRPMAKKKEKKKPLLVRAVTLAKAAHKNQVREGEAKERYFTHLDRVATMLFHYDIRDEITLSIAYLHDIIEDTYIAYTDLVTEFGEEIANAVRELSVDTRKTAKERHDEEMDQTRTMSDRAILVKLSDMFDNLTDMAQFKKARQINFAEKVKEKLNIFRHNQLRYKLELRNSLCKNQPVVKLFMRLQKETNLILEKKEDNAKIKTES